MEADSRIITIYADRARKSYAIRISGNGLKLSKLCTFIPEAIGLTFLLHDKVMNVSEIPTADGGELLLPDGIDHYTALYLCAGNLSGLSIATMPDKAAMKCNCISSDS